MHIEVIGRVFLNLKYYKLNNLHASASINIVKQIYINCAVFIIYIKINMFI